MKKCSKCNIEKLYIEFGKLTKSKDGYKSECKQCRKLWYQSNKESINETSKKYRESHKEELKEYFIKFRKENKEKRRLQSKEYKKNNPEKVKESQKKYIENNREALNIKKKEYCKNNKEKINKYWRDRRNSNPLIKLTSNLRNRTLKAFKKYGYKKNSKTEELIGISYEDLIIYIEKLFTEGMTWENQGKWHIDHIIPLSSAKTEDELIKLCYYTNLQPLWAKDNRKKWYYY